jgi:hypothetical protein
MLLAAAGVLGSVAVAHAQPAPDPAPSPAPVAPTPPAPPVPPEPEVAPAAMPAAPPPVAPAPVNWGDAPTPTPAAPTPATAKPDAPAKANPFSFTRFTWTNAGTTRIFGVGGDYTSSDDEVYSMDFGLNLRYTFFTGAKTKLFANVAGGAEVELTNSESTKTLREPLFKDMSAGLGVSQKLFATADKETSTSVQFTGSASLPTSLASRRQGKYLGTSLQALIFHSQKLAGSKADWFQNVLLVGALGWGHSFSRAYTPTTTELAVTQRPRQVSCDKDTGCSTSTSDQLSGASIAHDTVRLGAIYYLSIYKDVLSFGNSWEIAERYKYTFADTCVNLPSTPGCEPAGRLADAVTRGATTTFDVSFSYSLLDNLGRVDLGYTNSTNQIGENGLRRSVFYSPDAQFYLSFAAYLDGIYDKAASSKASAAKSRVGALPRFSFQ